MQASPSKSWSAVAAAAMVAVLLCSRFARTSADGPVSVSSALGSVVMMVSQVISSRSSMTSSGSRSDTKDCRSAESTLGARAAILPPSAPLVSVVQMPPRSAERMMPSGMSAPVVLR